MIILIKTISSEPQNMFNLAFFSHFSWQSILKSSDYQRFQQQESIHFDVSLNGEAYKENLTKNNLFENLLWMFLQFFSQVFMPFPFEKRLLCFRKRWKKQVIKLIHPAVSKSFKDWIKSDKRNVLFEVKTLYIIVFFYVYLTSHSQIGTRVWF